MAIQQHGDMHTEWEAGEDLDLDGPVGDAAPEDTDYRRAFDRGVRMLAQREHSVQELTTKLRSKGVPAAVAALVVDDLRGRGLQSDERFAEAFVHSRVGRAQGPIRIREELRQRGIGDDVADEVLTQSVEYWLELAAATHVRVADESAFF
ncbi:MAG: RecX family transcriptional regulator, partial [Pseudomonadales bacterium]